MLLGSVGWLKLMDHHRRVGGSMNAHRGWGDGLSWHAGGGGIFIFILRIRGERICMHCLTLFFVKQKICFVGPRAYVTPNKRGARNFC